MFARKSDFVGGSFVVTAGGVDALNSFTKGGGAFSTRSVTSLGGRSFAGAVKTFAPSRFGISAKLNVRRANVRLSASVFFRSIPSRFISVGLSG